MKLIILRRTEININNLPSEIFSIVTSIDVNINNDLILIFELSYLPQIQNVLNNYYNEHRVTTELSILLYNSIDADNISCDISANIPAAVQTLTERDVNTDTNNDLDANFYNSDDSDDSNDCGMMKNSNLTPIAPCGKEEEKLLIARSMKNSLSSSANLVMEKITELNKLMARTVILRNELDVLMKPVSENPKVNFILDQVKSINDSVKEDGFIKQAYINKEGDISILTKRIHTEKLDESETIRDVGEMEIIIYSTVLLSESLQTGTQSVPIKIKNLTHYLNNEEGNWACGHVRHEGILCFGRVYEQIHSALLSKNINFVLELIIKFIRNPDENDDWGKFILGFPIIQGGN